MTKPAFLEEIIKTALTVPADAKPESTPLNDKNLFKHPYVASEIIGCESQTIIDAFFTRPSPISNGLGPKSVSGNPGGVKDAMELETKNDQGNPSPSSQVEAKNAKETGDDRLPLLDLFFSFLDSTESESFETIVGYFSRCFSSFITLRPLDFFEYIQKRSITNKLFSGISYRSIANCILNLLLLESASKKENLKNNFKQERLAIMKSLLERYFTSSSPLEMENISFIFSEIFTKFNSMLDGKELLKYSFDFETKERLFVAVSEEKNIERSEHLLNLLIKLVGFYCDMTKTPQGYDFEEFEKNKEEIEIEAQNSKKQFGEIIKKRLGKLLGLLKRPQKFMENQERYFLQFKEKVLRFGKLRAKAVEFLTALISLDQTMVAESLAESEVALIGLKIVIEYPWTSMVHSNLIKIFNYTLEKASDSFSQKVVSISNYSSRFPFPTVFLF